MTLGEDINQRISWLDKRNKLNELQKEEIAFQMNQLVEKVVLEWGTPVVLKSGCEFCKRPADKIGSCNNTTCMAGYKV